MTDFAPEIKTEAEALLADFPNKKSALLMMLRLVERQFGFIDDAGMELAARYCEVSVAHVQGAVTFYTHFKRPYHGKHRLMVCATLMCAMGGHSDRALQQIEARLGLRAGERSADGLFSVEKVECLADCHLPPVVQVNFDHRTCFEGEALEKFLDSALAAEGKTSADYKGKAGVVMNARVPVQPVQPTLHQLRVGPGPAGGSGA
ncbi:MAG: NAD(P)H-dependent oxidoreductase subunit E [Deltaproteobacteria bacterium]|nr:NAD(P)H-dependent oxidoreductase subunit E [Deltaproteobacteria bacterium]